jgi:hypothetical protein
MKRVLEMPLSSSGGRDNPLGRTNSNKDSFWRLNDAGRSGLFLADAHPGVVAKSLRRLRDERGIERLSVDVVKVSQLLKQGDCAEASGLSLRIDL